MRKPLTNKEGEVRELTAKDFQEMKSMSEVLPAELVKVIQNRERGQRGKQKAPLKVLVTTRYSKEVVDYFKAEGKGWQKRVDEILKAWIKRHPHPA